MTSRPPAPSHPVEVTGTGRHEVATTRYARSPRDVLRVLVLVPTTLVLLALTRWARGTIEGAEADLVDLLSGLPSGADQLLTGALAVTALTISLGIWIVPIATRRYRLFGFIVLANTISVGLFAAAAWWLHSQPPTAVWDEVTQRPGVDPKSLVGVPVLVQLVAACTVLAPHVTAAWRRTGAIALTAMVVVRVVVAVQLPTELGVGVLIGVTVGSGLLLVFGRPALRPTDAALRAALVDVALPVSTLDLEPDPHGRRIGTLADGTRLSVAVFGEDERAADILYRLYRLVRLKNVGDERPFSNLRRSVEHEALLALSARDVGVRTPRLRGVIDLGADSMLLAFDLVEGRSLDALDPDEVDDDLLRATWEQVALLRRHRLAHRDLQRPKVLVDEQGRPWLTGFRVAELAASDGLLATDVAQLVTATAVSVGAERSVCAAVEVLGADVVGTALPRLQAMALSGTTRAAVKAVPGLLEAVQSEVVEQCAVEEIRYEQIDRVSPRTLFTVAMLAAVTYFLVPQFADLPGIIDQVRAADWRWLPVILGASAITYVGAAIALKGAVPDPLPFGPTMLTQAGSSFTGTLAPAGLGGMALNIRFLQKQGVDQPVAVSSVGLDTGAGGVGHLILLLVFGIWAGGNAFDTFRFPDPTVFLAVAGVLVLIGAACAIIPATRRMLLDRLVPVVARGASGVAAVLRRPLKLVELLGGSMLVTFGYLLCAFFSLEAFGGGLSFAVVGACYLLASAVASAAPTPGGLGAVEAAIIAALVAAGVDNSVAVPAVFLFRLATFWVPIAPGWLAFTSLRRQGYV